jgi:hypothetical protein
MNLMPARFRAVFSRAVIEKARVDDQFRAATTDAQWERVHIGYLAILRRMEFACLELQRSLRDRLCPGLPELRLP